MGFYYPTTLTQPLVGTKDGTTRTGVELENSYSTTESPSEPTKSFETGGYPKVALAINYTMGDSETANTIEMKVEESPDGTNWYQLTSDETSSGTSTISEREWTITGNNGSTKEVSIFLDIAYKFMRVSFKESGVSTNKGNVYCEGTLSGR